MSDACAALVQKGDPDRFMATMTAPPAARAVLWPLYAYNLEIARAPWASSEPMIAEMRLQWWFDALEEAATGRTPRAHEVMTPLAALIAAGRYDPAQLQAMAEARRHDIWDEPFADPAALWDHLDASAGNLMWQAAHALGAPERAEPVVRQFATGTGLANWLRAVPDLIARGKSPLPESGSDTLVTEALDRIAAARKARSVIPASAAPALRAGWRAEAVLRRAVQHPAEITTGLMPEPEIARRFRLLRLAMTGRW